jgi:hypothetical protein
MEIEHFQQLIKLGLNSDIKSMETKKEKLLSFLKRKMHYLTNQDKIHIQKLWENSGEKTNIFSEEGIMIGGNINEMETFELVIVVAVLITIFYYVSIRLTTINAENAENARYIFIKDNIVDRDINAVTLFQHGNLVYDLPYYIDGISRNVYEYQGYIFKLQRFCNYGIHSEVLYRVHGLTYENLLETKKRQCALHNSIKVHFHDNIPTCYSVEQLSDIDVQFNYNSAGIYQPKSYPVKRILTQIEKVGIKSLSELYLTNFDNVNSELNKSYIRNLYILLDKIEAKFPDMYHNDLSINNIRVGQYASDIFIIDIESFVEKSEKLKLNKNCMITQFIEKLTIDYWYSPSVSHDFKMDALEVLTKYIRDNYTYTQASLVLEPFEQLLKADMVAVNHSFPDNPIKITHPTSDEIEQFIKSVKDKYELSII